MRVSFVAAMAPAYVALLLGCNNGQGSSSTPASRTSTPDTPAAATTVNGDPDQAVNGAGVPAGYAGRTDQTSSSITDAKYTAAPSGGGWEVKTGPAHILYRAGDTASGGFTLRTEIDQLEAPHHPEAYGVFFGGSHLTDADQRYTYFIVRGNGMYAIKGRDGGKASTIVGFTASPNVPKADASGKATYAITVHSAPDTVHFFVNDKLVAAIPKGTLAVDGIAGIRINHNLHVVVKPLTITR
jgi:hypothetical protein